MDKLTALKDILSQDPTNVLARYGLAMEWASRGEVSESLKEFETLIAANPDYAAAYFMAAQTLAAAARTPEAIEKLRGGIAAAGRTGNHHALSEMQAMLDELDR